jgi:hypothetical protein
VVSAAVPVHVKFTVVVPVVLPERVTVNTIGSVAASAPAPSVTAAEIVDPTGAPSLSAIVPEAKDGVPTV